MKKLVCMVIISMIVSLFITGCSGKKKPSVSYELESKSGEKISVGVDAGDKYTVTNPTDSTFVVMDKDNNILAKVHMVSKAVYDSYKTAAASLPSFTLLKKNGMEGFSYASPNSNNGDDYVYARCYAVSDKTSMYMESSVSDDVLGDIFDRLTVKHK